VSEDIPKLHGWITPSDAIDMMNDFAKFLRENGYMIWVKWEWPSHGQWLDDPNYKKIYKNACDDMLLKQIVKGIDPIVNYHNMNGE